MIKAVFFDWFNTLARYEPPRIEVHGRALGEFGFEVPTSKLWSAILNADKYFFDENAISPIEKRSPEEKAKVYTRYFSLAYKEAGLEINAELLFKIMSRVEELFKGTTFVLFDDVLSVIKALKDKRLILGLLTNLTKEMAPICRRLGLEPYLDLVVTSGEVGADKPEPQIFLAALERAGVYPSEALHIGDQYKIDVVGARGVGINPILIDRYELYKDVSDCPRIVSLNELFAYL